MRTAPDYIQFYPTLRCNQSCEFCFNRSLSFLPDMALDDFIVMLDRITGLSIRTLDIMGGEPTLHPHIVGFVQEAVQRGLNVNISSNGSNTTALEDLLDAGNNVSIGISINDRASLVRLAGFIQKNKVVVKSVFHPTKDEPLIRDILALKPKKFYLIYRDALDRKDLHETVPFHQFVSLVEEQFNPSQADMVFCSGFIPDSVNYPELTRVRCPAGTTKLGILPDGSVYPCNLLFGKKEFLLGNILSDPFESIWSHKALTYFRSAPGRDCPKTTCELHTRCHGGCPAHGFAYTGSLSAPDPRCVGG
ncbi:MAG: radical SAM protein [Nitrospirae bacterium]|nr:radical SAM protein [Nitrospirota bacterium]